MNLLQILPVMRQSDAPPLLLDLAQNEGQPFQLSVDGDLQMFAETFDAEKPGNHGEAVALMHCRIENNQQAWYLVPQSRRLGLNGLARPLPVARIEPGALLSIDQSFWMVTTLWKPDRVDAPEDLQDKPCPVCGGELKLAPVVQCTCGRWSHLENPDNPDDEDALNCFLVAKTCKCERHATLEPQTLPDIPDKLLGPISGKTGNHGERGP